MVSEIIKRLAFSDCLDRLADSPKLGKNILNPKPKKISQKQGALHHFLDF